MGSSPDCNGFSQSPVSTCEGGLQNVHTFSTRPMGSWVFVIFHFHVTQSDEEIDICNGDSRISQSVVCECACMPAPFSFFSPTRRTRKPKTQPATSVYRRAAVLTVPSSSLAAAPAAMLPAVARATRALGPAIMATARTHRRKPAPTAAH